jgi:periplasmic protein TonB
MRHILRIAVTMAAVATIATTAAAQQREPKGTTQPVVVKSVKPEYTAAAKEAGIQGDVTLDVVVLEDGSVGDVKVTQSLDAEHGLDDQAVKAAKQWQFKPGTKNGKPVPVHVDMVMTFTLK